MSYIQFGTKFITTLIANQQNVETKKIPRNIPFNEVSTEEN